MLIIENTCRNPADNLTLEKNLCSLGCEIFMIWQNTPSVIAGRFTDIESNVNLEYAHANNIPVVRRDSGGGAVYLSLIHI